MKDLIDQLVKQGLPEHKAKTAVTMVISWVQEHYPVAGALANSWIRSNSDQNSAA
jgi:hypothetical protein